MKKEKKEGEETPKNKEEFPPLLEINVHDKVTGKAVGPGQK